MSLDSIRRRREDKLKKLRDKMSQKTFEFDDDEYEPSYEPRSTSRSSSSYPKSRSDLWEDDDWTEQEHPHQSEGSSFVLKMVISLFIVSVTYVTYHADMPFSKRGQEFVGQVMSREFNFKGVVAEVESRYGINPSILPTLGTQATQSQTVWSPEVNNTKYLSPIKGEVSTPFGTDGKGIQIATQDQEVKAIEEGWVTFVGNKDNLGKTIHIVHKNGTKSSYSGLQDMAVSEGDWVQPGQLIARMSPGSSLYFSLQMKDQYVDPMSVITFE